MSFYWVNTYVFITYFICLIIFNVAGSNGNPGTPGSNGAAGPAGPPGPQGNFFYLKKSFLFLLK